MLIDIFDQSRPQEIKPNKLITDLYKKFLKSTGVCTDTRLLQKGQIFFALKGPNFDGNQYAKQALAAGASFAVIDDKNISIDTQQYILVENVLETLQALATHHRQNFDIPFMGITGSNGKTTTKELLARILKRDFKVHFTQGNLNNHIGVPLTLLSMPADTEFAIIEMGANHVGDIKELCEMALPTHGLITNIGTAHLGEFGGKENLIRGKSELFDHLRRTKGVVFINAADEVLSNMGKRFPDAISYPNKECQLVSAKPFVNYLDHEGEEHSTELIGAYNFQNIAAAIAVGRFFEASNPYDAVDRYVPNNNRSEVINLESNRVVLDAYNANPDSMRAALLNLKEMAGDQKIAMLGGMKELGEYADAEHRKLMDFAEQLGIISHWVGEEFKSVLKEGETCFPKVEDLIEHLKSEPLSGATVLIKGSRSLKMEKLSKEKSLWI